MSLRRYLFERGVQEVMPESLREIHEDVQETKEDAILLADSLDPRNAWEDIEAVGDTIENARLGAKLFRLIHRGLRRV